MTITTDVSGSGSDPSNYVGSEGIGRMIGTVYRPPDGSTIYTVNGTVSNGTSTATMIGDSTTCTRPPTTYTCSAAVIPSQIEVGVKFTLRVTIDNTSSQYAVPMRSSTHPVDVTPNPLGSVTNLGPASVWNYNNFDYNDADLVREDDDLVTSTQGSYSFTVRVGTVDCNVSSAAYIVGNKSYLKSYGGEVWAGGSWPATQAGGGYAAGHCDYDPDNGRIHAFAAEAGNIPSGPMQYRGSGTQFTAAAFLGITGALGGDEGFSSASTRTPGAGNTWAPKGLTIANNTAGYSGRSHIRHCMTNYYDDTVDTAVPVAASVAAANTAGGRQRVMLSGGQTLNGFIVNNNSQIAVYVDGDVFINGNIELSSNRTSQAQLPYFALIVRGNIFIAPGVTRLDGLYIAQPSSVVPNLAVGAADTITKGRIYTCANSFSFVPANSLYDTCDNQLVVNGSLIADQIRWLRSFETMSKGDPQELPDFADGTGTKAAEVINYTPEMYLAPSPLKNPADGPADSSADAYDSVTTMPPVF